MTTPLIPQAVNDAPPPQELHAGVQRILAGILGIAPDDIAGHADLVRDLGATSLESIELVMSIEDAYGIEISDADAARVATVDDLERLVRARLTGTRTPTGH